MECGGKPSLDVNKVAEQGLELRRENRFAVTDNGVEEAMMLYHHVNNHFCQSWSINGDFDWLIMHNLGQAINYDKN